MASDLLRKMRADATVWARKCYHIRDKRGELVRLRANKAQRVVYDAKREMLQGGGNALLYVLKARQGGISTWMQADNLHTAWAEPGSAVMTLAHSRDDTDKIFRITRRAVDNFPAGLLPTVGVAQSREISFPNLDSAFWTGTAGAKRTGRGVTLVQLHGSEFAFWDDPLVTLNALTPALRPHGSTVVLETTASAHGSDAHGFWVDAEAGKNGYTAIFLPWWICDYDAYRIPLEADDELGALADDELDLMALHDVDLEQIKWRRRAMRQMGRSRFMQEYAEDPQTCWLVAGDLFYDSETLKYLLDRAPKPAHRRPITADGWTGHFDIYAHLSGEPFEREKVIVGVDVAEGGAKDRSSYVARTFPSGQLLEVLADSTIPPKALAGVLNERGRVLGDAFLVVEKNAHGITVLRELRDTHRYPIGKLFHRTVYDQAAKKPTQKIGWATTKESKPLMLDAGRDCLNAARDGSYGPPSADAVRDAFNVVRDNNGEVSLNGRDVLVAETLCWLGRSYVGGSYKSFQAFV